MKGKQERNERFGPKCQGITLPATTMHCHIGWGRGVFSGGGVHEWGGCGIQWGGWHIPGGGFDFGPCLVDDWGVASMVGRGLAKPKVSLLTKPLEL